VSLRFLADADFDRRVVNGVKRHSAGQIEFWLLNSPPGAPDRDVLLESAERGLILVTHDVSTMPTHFRHLATQRELPGVLLVPQSTSVRDAIESILFVWQSETEAEWTGQIRYLPRLR
jgi:hypothetical protein